MPVNEFKFEPEVRPVNEFLFEPELSVKLEVDVEESPALVDTRHCLQGCAVPGCRELR